MANAADIKRAAKHIDATELEDGNWAHYAEETNAWYVVTADELAELCEYLDSEDEQISKSAYSHWCAGTSAEEMPKGWEPGQRIYTYSIFDADPNSSTDTQWPGHNRAKLAAADLESAEERVEEIMSAARYDDADGYEVGQRIYALIWEDGVIVAHPTYTLTSGDIS